MKLPAAKIMYNALLNRDTNFEGVFFVAVKTTGIFCRPTCPARKPKAENVEFFATTNDALLAGYRACSRCKPLAKDKAAPELVIKLCRIIEESATGKIDYNDLKEMGIDPSTARRQFKRYYGMTFNAYCRARRLGQAFKQIREGESIVGSQIDTGFQSASGFWNAFKQLFGNAPSQAEKTNCLLAKWIDTPLGAMIAVAGEEGLYLLEFVDRRGLENEILKVRNKTKSIIVPGQNRHLNEIEKELKNYFEGISMSFTVPVLTLGSVFEKSIWELLQTIPAGQTKSYSDLAILAGKPGAVRAVGNANGKNCLSIIIPCHRVIGADGSLRGYGGGVWRKQKLLNLEKQFIEKFK